MARIRSIKPEFWTDPVMVSLPFETRLFFIGLWTFADDYGCLADEPQRLKLSIFPGDDIDPDQLLSTLIDAGRVQRRIAPDGTRFLLIPHFSDHQKIDRRHPPRFPLTPAESQPIPPNPAESPPRSGRDQGSRNGVEGIKDVSENNISDASLSRLLAELIEKNTGREIRIGKRWIEAERLLIERDQRDPGEAERLIRWCQADEFWRANVLSMAKFREKYDQLLLHAKRNRNNRPQDRVRDDIARLDERKRALEAEEAVA